MEILAEQPHKIEYYNREQRAFDDATTWLAEVLDGSMRTPFEYEFDGYELYAHDGGALGPIFATSIHDAERISHGNPRLTFELRRRGIESQEYYDMLAIMRGDAPNTMVVVSDFPEELMEATEDVGGYNVTRKQTMLRVLTRQGNRLTMYSQSLDGSDRQALEAIYQDFGIVPQAGELLGQRIHAELSEENQQFLTDRLTGVYDRNLAMRYGGQWYAGRPAENPQDTYKFVCSQHDLVKKFVSEELWGGISTQNRYNIAALLSKRFEESTALNRKGIHVHAEQVLSGAFHIELEWQLRLAGEEAKSRGQTFSGCGATAGSGEMSASEQLDRAGYGNLSESDEDQFGPLTFKCTKGHTNRRPRGKLITQCHISACKNSVGC